MIKITDNHAGRLARMSPALIDPILRDEVEAGAQAMVEDARFSILDGAISGAGHVASLPGEPPNADTHELDESIHAAELIETPGEVRSGAVADAPYALALELGTSRMAERPFLRPAAERARPEFLTSLAERLRAQRA